jgi:hypothetical protein
LSQSRERCSPVSRIERGSEENGARHTPGCWLLKRAGKWRKEESEKMTGRQPAENCRYYRSKHEEGLELRLEHAQVSSPPIHEREVLVRAPKNLTFEIYQKAYDTSTKWEREGNNDPTFSPRMVSFRSSGMPFHKWHRPSTMVLHSSRAACSASMPEGRRCASNVLTASKGVPRGAGGIKRTRRERMSPARRKMKMKMNSLARARRGGK